MNTDSKSTQRFNTIKQTQTSLSGKTLSISLALILGACASTGDKPTEVPAAETSAPAKTAAPASSEPAPSAAELMKSLRAPLKEPEPAKTAKSASSEMQEAKADTVEKVISKTDEVSRSAEKTADATVSSAVAKAGEVQQKTAAVTSAPVKTQVPESIPGSKTMEVVAEQKTTAISSAQVTAIDAKPFSVSAKQLPFTYDIWTIRKGNTSLTEGLVIVTPTWEMGKEGYMSQIWLTLMEDKIHINSSSDIEPASKGLGIRIDGGDLIPFTSIEETNIAVIEGRWLDRLARAGKIDIYLGFFPGKKPTSDTFKSDLSMNNLDRVVATYRVLNK